MDSTVIDNIEDLPPPGDKGRRYSLHLKSGDSGFSAVADRFPFILRHASHLHFVTSTEFPEVQFTTTSGGLIMRVFKAMKPGEKLTTGGAMIMRELVKLPDDDKTEN